MRWKRGGVRRQGDGGQHCWDFGQRGDVEVGVYEPSSVWRDTWHFVTTASQGQSVRGDANLDQ